MSLDAMSWALAQPVKSTSKLLLVAMAHCVNSDADEWICWPSQAFLAETTGLNRKTVMLCIAELENAELIAEIGRIGVTGRVAQYLLNGPKNGTIEQVARQPDLPLNGSANAPKNGTIDESNSTENGTIYGRANSPKNGQQWSQKRTAIVPKTDSNSPKNGTQNREGISNESGKKGRRRAAPPPARPDDVPDQVWTDWLELRRNKHAPVTNTVVDRARQESAKAGLEFEDFLRLWCFRGSQGLMAEWIKPDELKQFRRNGHGGGEDLPPWRAEQRRRMQQAAPGVAVRGGGDVFDFFEAEAAKRVK